MVKILFGLSVAIATPFDKKNKIELREFRNHISYLLKYNIKSFTFFGTTGEGPSISLKEKIKSLEYLLSHELKTKQTYVSIIQSSYKTAKLEIESYNKLGIKNFLVSPPFFFKELHKDALESWFTNLFNSISNQNSILLYNIPQITKIKIDAELIRRLQDQFSDNFVKGVKDSSGDIEQTYKFLEHNSIVTTVGDERLIAKVLKLGGDGSICGLSNIYPKEILDIIENKQENPSINKIVNKILNFPVVPAIKTLLYLKTKNKIWLNVRPPLIKSSNQIIDELKKII
ncbi:MAG: dihydrodipicolinate synthase family protein [Rhodobacterales bacterium]|nr:MAG: dihydrodipicolinate synthase family protein [Rhodobacterales bacterium]